MDRTRFMYGVNYAWSRGGFARDFGGAARWGSVGVAGDPAPRLRDLKEMRAHGVDTVRWWLFPEFWGEGVRFDEVGTPLGLGATTADDLRAALALAAQADVKLMLCLFSFDGFRPTREVGEAGTQIRSTSLQPLVTDPIRRAALVDTVVRPLARAVSESPHADRLVAWDVINEPEWAMSGRNGYGDPPYDPQPGLWPVTHAEMELFVAEVIAGLRVESRAPISIGSAGIKWARAWTRVDVDFYQVHLHDWVNRHFPYDRAPAAFGLTGKPVLVGEFPLRGLTGVPYQKLIATLIDLGYAGALGWSFTDQDGAWDGARADVRACAEKLRAAAGGGMV